MFPFVFLSSFLSCFRLYSFNTCYIFSLILLCWYTFLLSYNGSLFCYPMIVYFLAILASSFPCYSLLVHFLVIL
ncbi:hypothetical protein BCR41DRAFT_344606 [Lobosporangium transversale]|uniref:Uncharacterized protein n=1 Tax=Lobosporangium transversale TaxID=64571 RepID=A0A1Y2H548_9FUNG|nr:hypothetical protein BCR41DRAFT_344606 [Lobosporangium transversale]ORZ29134.1 hypothetical protein BCR41DRAFT_344606 [Lobosporangium transversale]|eukprot:XP_021886807.1 hypothetical protein BCR41DRAFT_344606 [Lobosporangium transversale]